MRIINLIVVHCSATREDCTLFFGGRTQSKLNYLKNRKEVNDGNEEIRMGHDPEGGYRSGFGCSRRFRR